MVSFQKVKFVLRPWDRLRFAPRAKPRLGITRPRWQSWTSGVVLQRRFKWGPSVPGLKLTFLAPHRASFRFEVPSKGPFRQSTQLYRRRREMRRFRKRVKYRTLFLGSQTRPPFFPPRMQGLPPRGYRQHFNFWAPRRKIRKRRFPFQAYRVSSRRRDQRRLRKVLHARPRGLSFFFRQDYLRGLSTLFTSSFQGKIFQNFSSNRSNLTVRKIRAPSYLISPSPQKVSFSTLRLPFSFKGGWPFPKRKVYPRRGFASGVTPPFRGMENLLEGVAHLQEVRYRYRKNRTGRVPRRRRRTQLVTRDERRGWIFRRPHPRRREQPFCDISSFLARGVHRSRRLRRTHRKQLTFRKRCRTNRVRQLRRRRKLWVPRRMWKLFRQMGRRPRRRWKVLRVGPHGTNRRGGRFHKIFPFFRSPWWTRRRPRTRLSTFRKTQRFLFRQRRNRQISRLSWIGVRGLARRVESPRRYLRQRVQRLGRRPRRRFSFGLGTRRKRRGRRGRGRRVPSGWLKARGSSRPDYPRGYHLGRWFGLFTRRGQTFSQEGREILRAIPPRGVTNLYHLFATSLGSRSRRRGGALLKVPTLLEPRQAWSQVRRWFTRGVATRGDRGWSNRVVHEILSPVGVARGREEFIRAALFNRALL